MQAELDRQFMQQALDQAKLAAVAGEVPVGAVLVRDGQVISTGFNQPISNSDPSAHAEMMAKHPGMEHDEPYMAHVDPGKKGDIVWTFNRAGTFE